MENSLISDKMSYAQKLMENKKVYKNWGIMYPYCKLFLETSIKIYPELPFDAIERVCNTKVKLLTTQSLEDKMGKPINWHGAQTFGGYYTRLKNNFKCKVNIRIDKDKSTKNIEKSIEFFFNEDDYKDIENIFANYSNQVEKIEIINTLFHELSHSLSNFQQKIYDQDGRLIKDIAILKNTQNYKIEYFVSGVKEKKEFHIGDNKLYNLFNPHQYYEGANEYSSYKTLCNAFNLNNVPRQIGLTYSPFSFLTGCFDFLFPDFLNTMRYAEYEKSQQMFKNNKFLNQYLEIMDVLLDFRKEILYCDKVLDKVTQKKENLENQEDLEKLNFVEEKIKSKFEDQLSQLSNYEVEFNYSLRQAIKNAISSNEIDISNKSEFEKNVFLDCLTALTETNKWALLGALKNNELFEKVKEKQLETSDLIDKKLKDETLTNKDLKNFFDNREQIQQR